MKKKLPLIVILLLVIIGGGVFAYTKLNPKTNDQQTTNSKKKKIEEPLNVIALEERPYIQLIPLADGRNITIAVNELKKPATSVEYELEYQAGSLLQGAFGEIDLSSIPATAKILFGSCSAGGACTYHEDIKGGTLLTRFSGPESYALKSRWKYIDNQAKETALSSQDAKFQIDSKELAKQRFVVIFNTAGYPKKLSGTPVSEFYSLTAASPLSGKAELSIRANEDGQLKIMGWNGQSWQEFDSKVEDKTATATVDLMELYVVVK